MRSVLPRLPATVVVVVLLAAGCTTAGPSGGPRADGDAVAPPGVLRVGLERPQSLDPVHARFPAELLVVDQLFDSLTAYDPATLEVRPAVASRWEATPDQKSWLFTIRPGAEFSNGRSITAADVKYSLERVARSGTDTLVAHQLGTIIGYTAFREDETVGGINGVSAVDAGTVRIDLEFPFAGFPAVLGHPALGIVAREAVEASSPPFDEQPVGSGPFMIRSRSADVLRLIPAPGTRAELDSVEIHLARDSLAPYTDFLRGRLDWAAVPAERVEEVEEVRGDEGFRPYPAQVMYGFNLEDETFADPRFREAIVRALDRPAIVREGFGDRVRPTSGLVAEGVPGHQPDACGDACRYDPARSRALLAEVFGDGPVPEVAIDYDDNPVQESIASAIAAHLRSVGIPTRLRAHPFAAYVNFAATGQQELFHLAWIATYPTADAFLTPLFYTGQDDNVTGFSDPEVDSLLAVARAEPDDHTREVVYQEAERQILARYPVIPLAQYETHTIVSDRVQGLQMSAFGTFDATRVSLTG